MPSSVQNDRGSAIVFLHGVNNTPGSWDAIRGEMVTGPTLAVRLAPREQIADIAAIAWEGLPDRVVLVGHSLGGYVALEMLHQHPERVRAIALVNSSASADQPEAAARRAELAERARNGEYGALAASATAVSYAPRSLDNPDLMHAREVALSEYGAEAFAAHQFAAAERSDHTELLRTAQVPKLVIAADDDRVIPTAGQADMAHAAGCQLVIVPGAGHMITVEQPAAIARALDDWLIRHDLVATS